MASARGHTSMTPEAKVRRERHQWGQSPYQYADSSRVKAINNSRKYRTDRRWLVAQEEQERRSDFPSNYIRPAKTVTGSHPKDLERARKSLLGNAWTVPQASFWVSACLVYLFAVH